MSLTMMFFVMSLLERRKLDNLKLIRFDHTVQNERLIQSLLANAPSYCLTVSGEIAGINDGKEVFTALPPNFPKENKHVIGIFSQNTLIGMIDCLIGFPTKEKAHIGLLLISESYQSQGLGKSAYQNLEHYLRTFSSISKIRLAVVVTNKKVLKYWENMGFTLTGEIRPHSNKLINSESLIMEKELV